MPALRLAFLVNNNMVYDNETLTVLHPLTKVGEAHYRQFLEDEGTRILEEAKHPILSKIKLIVDFVKLLIFD